MNAPKTSLSEKLSSLLAALRKSQPQQSNRNATTASSIQANCDITQTAEDPSVVIETLPELLEFLKSARNPKVLRDVVARFLLKPSLSESDRELIRIKVREKVDEEKKRKRELKMLVTNSNTCEPFASLPQHLRDSSFTCAPEIGEQTAYSETQGMPLYNGWMHDVAPSNASSMIFDFVTQPQPVLMQNFNVPPPSAVMWNFPPNHGHAGFGIGGAPLQANTSVCSPEHSRDMIPRTPTPSPPLPSHRVDPSIRPGEIVAVLSATGRLIMPGAPITPRLFKPNYSDLEDVEHDTTVNWNYDDKSLEKTGDFSKCDGTTKKISSLFSSLPDESFGKACYIQQYALRHNLSFEEAEKKVDEKNEMFRKQVVRRRSRKNCKSGVYTKGFEPLPNQKYAKNCESVEENLSQLNFDKRYCPEGEELEIYGAEGYEVGSYPSSSCGVTDSSVPSELEYCYDDWSSAYFDCQATPTQGRTRKRRRWKSKKVCTAGAIHTLF